MTEDEEYLLKESFLDEEYIVVTAITTFRQKYCIPKSQLQLENTSSPVDKKWALDCVTSQDVSEFSQKYLGEEIVDMHTYDVHGIIELFDEENDYLNEWTTERKLAYIEKWKVDQR